jgi:AcrR family transcriptional regulator
MPRDTIDRRVRRTRARLLLAAQSVLNEGCWADLSVRDIADRADIARSSFYAHFTGKGALLSLVLSEALTDAEAEIAACPARPGRLRTVGWLAAHLASHRMLYSVILADPGEPDLRRLLSARIEAALGKELGRTLRSPDASVSRFVAAGLIAVSADWLARPRRDRTALDDRLSALVEPLLAESPVPA